jgi:hypothetical protein
LENNKNKSQKENEERYQNKIKTIESQMEEYYYKFRIKIQHQE